MSLASEMTRLQTAKENFQVALEYLGGSVEQDELFSDYPDKFAHMPYWQVPEEVNWGYGYIDGNGWHYENKYQANPIDIYKIKQGHSYFVMLGEHIGTRFRVCTVLEQDDIRTKTSGVYKDMALMSGNAPKGAWPVMAYRNPDYGNANSPFFTAAHDGWLLIQKDNKSDQNVKSYVFDIDTPVFSAEDYIEPLDENLFDITNGLITLKSGADTSTIRGRIRIPATVNGQTVTGLGPHCFDGLTTFGAIEFEGAENITTISEYALANTSLISGDYPISVTTIGDYAYANCTGLRGTVYIRQNVTSLGVNVWENTTNLTDCAIWSPYITTLTRSFKGSLANYIGDKVSTITTLDGTFYNGKNVTNVASATACPNLTTITNGAYYGCLKLVDITIPSNITTIGPETFKNSVNLEAITLSNSTPPTLLNSNAFENTNDCPIYVPDSAVSAYQSATNWSDLATRITGVSNKP